MDINPIIKSKDRNGNITLSENRWKLQKYHLALHVAMEISRFGSPMNTETDRCESNHIAHAKIPAKTAPRKVHQFLVGVAHREHENLLAFLRRQQFGMRDCDETDPDQDAELIEVAVLRTEPATQVDVTGSAMSALAWGQMTFEVQNSAPSRSTTATLSG